ncbi:MAG: S24 family peptidase [Psychrobacter sp.]|nr:S24 family peptidase [Psychrobacter sp.]
MDTLVKNLDHLMHLKKTNATKLYDDTGVPQSTTSRILNGETSSPSDKTLKKYAKYFNVSVADLRYKDLTTTGLPVSIANSSIDDLTALRNTVDDLTLSQGNVSNLTIVPVYSTVSYENDSFIFRNIVAHRGVENNFFIQNGLTHDQFRVVQVDDDSMAPYINNKDAVGIILSDKNIKDGQIYAIMLEGDRMFKQIFLEGGGRLRLHSFNPNYPDRIISGDERDSVVIIGKQHFRSGK